MELNKKTKGDDEYAFGAYVDWFEEVWEEVWDKNSVAPISGESKSNNKYCWSMSS